VKPKIKWIAVALGAVVCLLAAAFFFRDRLIAPRLIPLLQEVLRRELGVEVTIGHLRGSFLSDVEIGDLQTLTPGSRGPVTALAAKRLSIHYSPFALLKGPAGFVEAMHIEAEGLRAELDLGRGEPSSERGSSPLIPLVLPAVRVRDAAVALRWGELRTLFEGITLDVEKDPTDPRRIRLAVAEWSWSHPRLAAGRTTVAALLALTPGWLEIQELSLGGGRIVANARLGSSGPTARSRFESEIHFGVGSLSLAGDLGASILNTKLTADQIEIEPIAGLFLQSISGRLSTEFELSVPLDRPDGASGQLKLDVRNAEIQGIGLSKASLAAKAGDGWVRVAELEAASRRSRLRVTEGAAPLRQLLEGAWGDLLQGLSGRFELFSEDLPELFKMAGWAASLPANRIPEHRLELAGRFDGGYMRIPTAGLTSGSNRILLQAVETRLPPAPGHTPIKGGLHIDLPDLEALSRILPIAPFSGRVKADATIGGTLGRPEADATLAAENLMLAGLHAGTVSLKAHCTQQTILVKTLDIQRGEDTLSGNGSVRLPAGHIETAELAFAIADLEWLGARLLPATWPSGPGRPRIQGRARGQARLTGHWRSPDGEFTVSFDDLQMNGQRFGGGSVRILKKGGIVTADPIQLAQGSDRLDLHGSYDIAAGQIGGARLQLECGDIAPYLNALTPQWNRLSGRVTALIEGSGPLGQPDFKLDLYLERIQTAGPSLGDTRLQAQGSGRQIRIETAETLTPAGRLRVAGRLTRDSTGAVFDAALEAATLKGDAVLLTMAAPARIRYEVNRRLTVDRFEAGGPQGRIAVRGLLAFEGKSDLTVELAVVNGAGWLGKVAGTPLVIDEMDASLHLGGTTASPEIALTGAVRRLGTEGRPLTLSGRFELAYSGQRLRIDRFEWTGPDGQRVALTGSLPVDPAGDRIFTPGVLSLSAAVSLPDQYLLRSLVPDWPIASGIIEAEMALQGTWAAPRGALRVQGHDLNLADSSGFAPPGPWAARVEMIIEERRMHCQTLQVQGPHAQLQGTGVWRDYPSFDQWLKGRPAAEGTVDLEGRLVAPDLGWLARSFKGIRRVAGRLEADVKAEGPLRDPRLQADLRLTDGELRPEANTPPLQALNLQAGFSGRNLEIRRLRGELGGAPFQATGAIENILAPEAGLRMRLHLNGEDLLLHRSRAFRARANTDLRLSGPLERLELSGSLTLTDGLFTQPFGLAEGLTAGSAKPKAGPGFALFSIETPPFRDMRFDVQVGASRPLLIKNNLVKGAVRPDLRLVGTGEAPELVGRIYLDPTVLFLPAGRMQFDSGVILFEAVDPGRPRLDMIGTGRMIGYDITAAVAGPYDEPSVSLSSVPPLPDAELLTLVLTGQPPKIPGEPVEKREDLNVAVFIGRDVLMRMPGGETGESLQTVLERFDVELGRSVTRAGDETINARFRVADGLLRPGDTLYLTGEKDVYDHYNAGVRIVFRFR
jgi:autotransporter translocation and assembly factor TamB